MSGGSQPTSGEPAKPVPADQAEAGKIPAWLEAAIFKRFWLWTTSLGAIIVAMAGLTSLFTITQIKEYAKNVADNNANAEWANLKVSINNEMLRLHEDLAKTTSSAHDSVKELSRLIGQTAAMSEFAHRQATDVEGTLKQLDASLKSSSEIFAAKSQLDQAIQKAVESPNFQAQFGARVDTVQSNIERTNAKLDALKSSIDAVNSAIRVVGGGRILAIAEIRGGALTSATSGVAFASETFTFPNPRNLKYVPVLTETSTIGYITRLHFVNGPLAANQFRISAHALDTGGLERTFPAGDLTVAVVGFDPQ